MVSSAKVFERHGAALVAGGGSLDPEPFLLPDGEAAKSWRVLGRLLEWLVGRGLKRDSGIVALGGGTVGDVAGLAASLALRGVPLVQVPTTLLASADSALGGKTAVNLAAGKNLAGTVHQPALVLADVSVLRTLEDRDFRSGLAEVVKASCLDARLDRAMTRLSPRLLRREDAAIAEAVWHALRMKARFVSRDPHETRGLRVALNLGHTIGHALETASRHELSHGEAVAWGLLAILRLSTRRAALHPATAERLARRVQSLVAPPHLAARLVRDFPAHLGSDKKATQAGLRAVFLSSPGRFVALSASPEELRGALAEVVGESPSP